MKKTFINIMLGCIGLAGLAYASIARGFQFFIGFVIMYVAVLLLIKVNTDWIKEY